MPKAKTIQSEITALESLSFEEIEAKVLNHVANADKVATLNARNEAAYKRYGMDDPYFIRYMEILDERREKHQARRNELQIKIQAKKLEIEKIAASRPKGSAGQNIVPVPMPNKR